MSTHHVTVTPAEDWTCTAWVCTDCNAAVAGTTSHEAGHPLPVPFDGDDSVTDPVNGMSRGCGHWNRPWEERTEHDVDEHSAQCETRDFDKSPCESCGTYDAGTRHAVTITVR